MQNKMASTRRKTVVRGIGIAFISGLIYHGWPQPPTPAADPSAPAGQKLPSPPKPAPAGSSGFTGPEAATAKSAPTPPSGKTGPDQTADTWIEHRIHRGETLAGIFKRYDLSTKTLHTLLHSDDHLHKELARLYPGETVRILTNDEGRLQKLVYQPSQTEVITFARDKDGFNLERIFREPERRLQQAGGTIQDSLYIDGKKAGLNDKLVMQMTEIFGWDIDFARSIRPGDRFTVLYEKHYVDGRFIGEGDILAAEFINQDRIYRALRFTFPDGHSGYYTPDGKSMRKAFLRTPVKSARITSRFNLHRRHPILHRIRAHKGVDYAAPIGTPVRATGDGRIVFRGRKGGYGRVIILQHGHGYSTLYAHLHRFNPRLRLGSTVRQGDIIAYVGKSGLATGPHLHYEFRIHGVHRDPLTVPLPKSQSIPDSLLARFKRQTTPLLAALDQNRRTTLAQAKAEE